MAYDYQPKGIDIRVNKGRKKKEPSQEICDWPGCEEKGGCRAPKSPDRLREYHNFCQKHAREYNKNWNFFSGMSDDDIANWQQGARHGHRPTWGVEKNTAERSQARKQRTKSRGPGAYAHGYNIFGDGKEDIAPRRRQLSRMAIKALNDLGLDESAQPDEVRKTYTRLVKQLHPDANRGDRSTEESFARVVKAYKILRSSNLA